MSYVVHFYFSVNTNEDPDKQVLKLSMYPEISLSSSAPSGQRHLTTTPIKYGGSSNKQVMKLQKKSQTKVVQNYLNRNLADYDSEKDSVAGISGHRNLKPEKVCGKTAAEWSHYLRSPTPRASGSESTFPSTQYKLGSDGDQEHHRPRTRNTRLVVTGHPSKRVSKLYVGYTAASANIHLSRQSYIYNNSNQEC